MKVVVLAGSMLLASAAALVERPVPAAKGAPASFAEAGARLAFVERTAAPSSAAAPARERPPSVAEGPLERGERGPSPWQKDGPTRARELRAVLDRVPGDEFDR